MNNIHVRRSSLCKSRKDSIATVRKSSALGINMPGNCAVVLTSLQSAGNTYLQNLDGYQAAILAAVDSFKKKDGSNFVHYFNTTGVLQHNDINPLWHPTDTGHIKVCIIHR